MILGGIAFTWGNAKSRAKDFPLSVMRHEMMHAAHNELALGWLLSWRDAFTELQLYDWMAQQKSAGRISELDFLLATGGLQATITTAPNLEATELFASTEGFVTALPFLPAMPKLSLLRVHEVWPASISELHLAGDHYGRMQSVAVRNAALARVEHIVCHTLTLTQRNSLTQWLQGLIDTATLNPTPADTDTVNLVKGFFSSQTQWLNDVLTRVKKLCPK